MTLVKVCPNPKELIGPPLTGGITLVSFFVRSGLMISQLCPRSVDRKTTFPAT